MDFKKVDRQVGGLVNDNVRKLESVFPSVIKDGEVDFEELKELLGDFKEVRKEKYEMNWVGKKEAKKVALSPLCGKTLKYIEGDGKNEDTTENLYIEGDNLEVLKLLQNSYYGKVKMIYIDPPYNTGNDFIYNDDFREKKEDIDTQEGNVNEFGEKLVKNQKTSSHYHSKWMSMMYSRLLVCKNLLKDDGFIFISIDENEVINLKKICDEIFGENNFVSQITVVGNPRGRDYGGVAVMHDYIFVYQKSDNASINLIQDKEKEFKLFDNISGFELRELRNRNIKFNKDNRPNLYYPFYINEGVCDDNGLFEICLEKREGLYELFPSESQGIKTVWRWGKSKAYENLNINIKAKKMKNGSYQIVEKYREERTMARSVWWNKDTNTEKGTLLIKQLFEGKYFDYPKPMEMIKRICEMGTDKDDIILDFFSGSATTAHAVMQLNSEDKGKRKYIMVQIPEETDEKSEAYKAGYKNICKIGKERIRRAGEKILEENKDKGGIENLDIGFKVFRVENTNIRWQNQLEENGQIKYDLDGKNIDDIDFVPHTKDIDVVYEILLRHYGIPLTANIEKLDFIGNRTYAIQDSIIVCLEIQITKDIVDKISELEPVKVIFRDSAFGEDISLKQNSVHRLNVLIEKNNKNTTHVVEFI